MARSASRAGATRAALLLVLPALLGGCAAVAGKVVGGTVESLGASVAADDDPELVAAALPIALKLLEARIARDPRNPELLLSACRGYTQYAHAFVSLPADYLEDTDLEGARRERARAGRLFLRARGFCLRAIEVRLPGSAATLAAAPEATLRRFERRDAELLHWTAASWAAAIGAARGNLDLVADLGVAHRLARRACALSPERDDGATHELLITLEGALAPASGGSVERAREHFRAARALSRGRRVGPLVALAEAVSVKAQDLAEFRRLLEEAVAFDVESVPEARLVNTLSRRRAEWLLARTEDLFVEAAP